MHSLDNIYENATSAYFISYAGSLTKFYFQVSLKLTTPSSTCPQRRLSLATARPLVCTLTLKPDVRFGINVTPIASGLSSAPTAPSSTKRSSPAFGGLTSIATLPKASTT